MSVAVIHYSGRNRYGQFYCGRGSEDSKGYSRGASQEQRTTSWVLPVATAVVLIAAFCMYYFVYVKAQREYLGNRNFRSLAALGDQLQKMVTIHGSILEFYADMSSTKRHVREPHRERVNSEGHTPGAARGRRGCPKRTGAGSSKRLCKVPRADV